MSERAAPVATGSPVGAPAPTGSPVGAPSVTQKIALLSLPTSPALCLTCVAKRTYSIGPKGKLSVADEQAPLVTLPSLLIDEHGTYKLLRDDSDVLTPKEATDIVVMGSAHAPSPTRELFIAVAVGGTARRLRVCGERRAEVRPDGSVSFTQAEAFEKLPLSYEHAYGGYDGHAHFLIAPPTEEEIRLLDHPEGLFAYPRNGAGVGYFMNVERRRADGALLPRIEDPSDALLPERLFVPVPEAWLDAPLPGGLGWMHHAWYPRFVRFVGPLLDHLPPLRPIREIALGCGEDLADPQPLVNGTLHPRALQGAAPGLSRERLRGDEPVVLQNLHRSIPDLRFSLPGESPRFSLKPPDVKVFSPKATLQTVRIEPDLDRVSLTWCGVVPILAAVDAAFIEKCELGVRWG